MKIKELELTSDNFRYFGKNGLIVYNRIVGEKSNSMLHRRIAQGSPVVIKSLKTMRKLEFFHYCSPVFDEEDFMEMKTQYKVKGKIENGDNLTAVEYMNSDPAVSERALFLLDYTSWE